MCSEVGGPALSTGLSPLQNHNQLRAWEAAPKALSPPQDPIGVLSRMATRAAFIRVVISLLTFVTPSRKLPIGELRSTDEMAP